MVSLPTLRRNGALPSVVYPFKGIFHFIHHPRRIAGPILLSALKASVLSFIVIIPLFKYGYGIQARLISQLYMAIVPGQHHEWLVHTGASMASIFFCIFESFAATIQIHTYVVGSFPDRFFDTVLQERQILPPLSSEAVQEPVYTSLDAQKPHKHYALSPVGLMMNCAKQEQSYGEMFVRPILYIATLPLNLIPVAGPFLFMTFQAMFRGGEAHKHYFDLYHWNDDKRQKHIEDSTWSYQLFGMVATTLEMIPFAGFIFNFTSQIGAAMWIADVENSKKN
ncbi:hypothetical protein BDF14DRAFT_1809245 [Spinellus fusiger]|nr:hypothetical protein BDF14DRAFT_1809245 [Spinellus fusiger]